MTVKTIKTKAIQVVHKTGLKLRQKAPDIAFWGGLIGTSLFVYTTCVKTLEAKDDIEEFNKTKAELVELKKNKDISNTDDAAKNEQKECVKNVLVSGVKVAKHYILPAVIGTASVVALRYSHRTLKERNSALGAHLATTTMALNNCRERVRNDIGFEKERDIFNKTITNGGSTTQTTEQDGLPDTTPPSNCLEGNLYSFFFDETNPDWKDSPEYNLDTILRYQCQCQKLLERRGYLFLNEVRRKFGLDDTEAGQYVGWIWTPDKKVDFGIWDPKDPVKRAFVNGYETAILLTPNIDGYILDDFRIRSEH